MSARKTIYFSLFRKVANPLMSISIHRGPTADLDSLLLLMCRMQSDDPWSISFNESLVRKNLLELRTIPTAASSFSRAKKNTQSLFSSSAWTSAPNIAAKALGIDELFIEPTSRGQGIGTQLLAESASLEQGGQALDIELNHGNPAVELYRHRGFVGHQGYLMTRCLTPIR